MQAINEEKINTVNRNFAKLKKIEFYDYLKHLKNKKVNESVIISINGSVSVGKTSFSKQIKKNLEDEGYSVEIISTDSFLLDNAELSRRNWLNEKGFPKTYQINLIEDVLARIREDSFPIKIPKYSHLIYDIETEMQELHQADFFILEGLQFHSKVIKELIDKSIFLEADLDSVFNWYQERTYQHIKEADDHTYFSQFKSCSKIEIQKKIEETWEEINLKNYYSFISCEKKKSDMIIHLNENHDWQLAYLRN